MDSAHLTFFLSVTYLSTFTFSQNWRDVLLEELVINVTFALFTAVLLFLLFKILWIVIKKSPLPVAVKAKAFSTPLSAFERNTTLAITAIAINVLVHSNLLSAYNILIGIESELFKRTFYVLALAMTFTLFHLFAGREKLSALNKGIIAIVIVSLITLTADVAYSKRDNPPFTTSPQEKDETLTFQHKPNIYCLVVESYPSEAALRKVFNIKDGELISFLKNKNLLISGDFHSNSQATFSSMVDLLAMKDLPALKRDLEFQRA
ncbi:hypothetical protein N9M41_05920, partial [Rhodopirellula sp.]|nr:hypothetical protein [Rhodopirellula sp.]